MPATVSDDRMGPEERHYLEARAEEERAWAERAGDPHGRRIHLALERAYRRRLSMAGIARADNDDEVPDVRSATQEPDGS